MHKGLKNFLNGNDYTVLEYMGTTKYFNQTAGHDYGDFRNGVKFAMRVSLYKDLYYWMVRTSHDTISYYGHDNVNIYRLVRGYAKYEPGMYKEIEDGVIAPLANGHEINENCWKFVGTLAVWE